MKTTPFDIDNRGYQNDTSRNISCSLSCSYPVLLLFFEPKSYKTSTAST